MKRYPRLLLQLCLLWRLFCKFLQTLSENKTEVELSIFIYPEYPVLSKKLIKYIDTHTAGSPTRHLLGGVPRIPGASMAEKMLCMRKDHDWLRKLTMQEPRGHASMSGTLYTEPCNPKADMGILYFDACDYMEMCGHSTIAVATVLVETGMVSIAGDSGTVTLDTPAGLIEARVRLGPAGVESATFRNVPSFLYASRAVSVPPFGEVPVEVAFGGMAYAIVRAKNLGLRVEMDAIGKLAEAAQAVYAVVQKETGFRHPDKPFIDRIHSVMIVGDPVAPGTTHKEVVVCMPSREGDSMAIDRSPCGTGTSAMVAADYALGRIRLNQPVINEGIIGTCFTGVVVEDARVGDHAGGVPEISGSAYFMASGEFLLDGRDPIQQGFILL